MHIKHKLATSCIAIIAGTQGLYATDHAGTENSKLELVDIAMERIQVIGEATSRKDIVGSATRLDAHDLEVFNYQDINRVLRMVPGVNIQEEDGYGLRPNIGLRGSGVERSAKITLMEDGVLIAPAPYSAPSAYYFPTTGRMEGIEVRKGSAAVKFGPRSVGGAVNLVSRSIPDEFSGFANLAIGSDGLKTVHSSLGGSGKNIAGVIEVFDTNNDGFKELVNQEDTGFDVEDYLAKLRIFSSEGAALDQALEIKISRTNSSSNETYLGISDADFSANPFQRYVASELDNIDTKHEQLQITYEVAFDSGIQLVTTAYRNEFDRDWFKFQDLKNTLTEGCEKTQFVLDNPSICETELSWLKGDEDSSEGAIRLRHNARSYRSKGIQSLIAIPLDFESIAHELEISVRYHEDYEDRLQFNEQYTVLNGNLEFASKGALGSAGNRVVSAEAWAFFIEDTIEIGKWTLVPGFRYESIGLNRSDWSGDDPTRAGAATIRGTTRINVFIPGIGMNYDVDSNLTLTGGLYKGFNPPGAGNSNAQEEESINVEFGAIYDRNGAYLEGMVFYSDYSNILGTCTAAVGCSAGEIGDQFNGGAARILGLELLAGYTWDLGSSWQLPLSFNYTYTDAEFKTDFEDSFWGDVSKGDDFPYLSAHQFTVNAAVTDDTWNVALQANYVSSSIAVAGAGENSPGSRIDSRFVIDMALNYQLTQNASLFVTIDNVFDTIYAVARRPIGLRPGKPRTWKSGLRLSF